MTDERPFGPIDPNSQHQRWSRWIFGVDAQPNKLPTVEECVDNARRFFQKGFGSVGRVRCDSQGTYYCFVCEVEGPPAHDPEYVAEVKRQFKHNFMYKGFGFGARLTRFTVGFLAGDKEDGSPPDQLIVMPTINLQELLHTP